jgi:hypothetical protein
MATSNEFTTANSRMRQRRASTPLARAARYDAPSGKVVIELDTGLEVRFRPQDAQGLATATADELAEIEISPSGLGIHFPIIDADLYIPALLQGFLGSRAWASAMGRAGGATSTEAKAAAARANGRLGGRPRKTVKRAAIKVI